MIFLFRWRCRRRSQPYPGGGDDVFIGTLFQDGVDEHGLGIGIVEGFADDLVVFQDGRHVVFGEADEVRADVDEGIDVVQSAGPGRWSCVAQVADHVGLAVEVAGIDGIEVDEVQMADAGPGQVDGGAELRPPSPADGDAAGATFWWTFGVWREHIMPSRLLSRQAVFGDEIDFIALFQGQVLCRGKAVDDGGISRCHRRLSGLPGGHRDNSFSFRSILTAWYTPLVTK